MLSFLFRTLPRLAATLVLAALCAASARAQLLAGPQYSAGLGASSLAAGDCDGDGLADLLAGNALGVAWLAGDGSGAFAPGISVVSATFTRAVASADVNGDADPDLISVSSGGLVRVHHGAAGGAFSAAQLVPLAGDALALAIGDLNADGAPDAVIAENGPAPGFAGSLAVCLGGASSALGAPAPFSTQGAGLRSVALGDLNGDGVLDAVAANHNSSQGAVLLGDGAGGFQAVSSATWAPFPCAVALADFDVNGAVDAAFACDTQGTAVITLGDGNGGLGNPLTFGVGAFAASIATGDVNGDGRPDFVTANVGSDDLSLTLSKDAAFAPARSIAVGKLPAAVILHDVNADGRLDAAAACSAGVPSNVTVFVNPGQALFPAAGEHAAGSVPAGLAAADLNLDGAPDLVTASSGSDRLAILLGDGTCGFGAASSPLVGPNPRAVAAGDWNGDGRPDVAAANGTGAGVILLLGDGAMGFAAVGPFPVGAGPRGLAAGDVNNDGRLDLVAVCYDAFQVSPLLGDGNGAFASAAPTQVAFTPTSIAAADVDADGNLDVVTTNEGPNQVTVCRGDGTGAFPILGFFITGAAPQAVAIGEVSGDDRPDLVTAGAPIGSLNDDVSVLLGSGGGLFGAPAKFAVGVAPRSLALADVDADGRLDVAAANSQLSNVAVLLSSGAGFFQPARRFATRPGASAAVAVDFDGDGRVDVATASADTDRVSVLRNLSTAPLGTMSYGFGTPGCSGILGIAASSAPHAGNAAFGIETTNAPPSSFGLLLIGNAPVQGGADLFSLGFTMHLDPFASSILFGATMVSNAGGTAFVTLPIPPDPSIAGTNLFAQSIFFWPPLAACDPSIYGLTSSRGLRVVLLH